MRPDTRIHTCLREYAGTGDWYAQATGARCCAPRVTCSSRCLCTQVTCLTSTRVQLLTCKLQRDTLLRLEEAVLAALARADPRHVAAGQVRVVLFAVGSTPAAILQVLNLPAALVTKGTNTDVN
jgi:hypothetical protein